MANELQFRWNTTGLTNLLGLLQRANGQHWNNVAHAWQTYQSGVSTATDFLILLAEMDTIPGDDYLYAADLPSQITGPIDVYFTVRQDNGDGTYTALTTGPAVLPINAAGVLMQQADPVTIPATGGADSVTAHLSISGVPVQSAATWVTTDSLGVNPVMGPLYTDSSGNAAYLLTIGLTYYFWARKDGINAVRGQSFVAASTNNFTTTAATPPVVAGPGQTVVTGTTLDASGDAEADVVIEYRLMYSDGTAGRLYPGAVKTATSDSEGLITLTLVQGTTYEARRDSGAWVAFTTGTTGSDTLPELIGRATG